jgi:ParB family transcriptional regulator, chromosome partitioning protein
MARLNLLADLIDEGTAPAANQPVEQGDRPHKVDRPFASTEKRPSRPTPQLGTITQTVDVLARAEEMQRQLSQGQTIVELDPADLDASFVPDRMAPSEEDHQELLRSIRDRGQIVPVLVRPHPTENGRYQIAFGHRRVRALKELSLKVKATVRNLTDEELVVAQGQENNARTNLSFIERARFAKQLEDRKFTREVISQSLCIDPGNLSRLISVASSIPLDIIDAIGPAPSIGQGRWMDLSASMDNRAHQKVRKAFTSDDFQRLSSDARFQFVLAQVKKTERAQTEAWTANDGLKVAKYTRGDKKFQLTLDEKLAPEFGNFLLAKLDSLYSEFRAQAHKSEE